MKKEVLIKRAQELEIQVPDGATNEEIKNLIKIEEHALLESENAKLEETLEAAQKVNAELEKEKKEATDELADLTQKLSDAEKALEASKADQSKLKVESKSKGGNGELPTYEHGDETYQFTVNRLVTTGGKITAEEAVEDKDLMASLIKSKFFGLKKV